MNYLLLRLTAKLTHTKLCFWRALLGAAAGSLGSLLVLLPPMPYILSLLCKLMLAVLMCLTAFGLRDKKQFVWHTTAFLGLSCVLAGMLLALTATGHIVYVSGCWYPVISLRMLVVLTILAYGVLTLTARIRERFSAADGSYEICIRCKERTVSLEGLADTGNTLTDFVTGKPVIICSEMQLEGLSPARTRLLPYSTVAGDGLLTVFTPDEAVIRSRREGTVKAVEVLIGIDTQPHKQAIFHPKLLR